MKTTKARLTELLERKIRSAAKRFEEETGELLEELANDAIDEAHAQVDALATKLRKHAQR